MEYESSNIYLYPGYDHVFQFLLKDLENEKCCRVIDRLFNNQKAEKMWNTILRHPTINEKFGEIFSTISSGSLNIPNELDSNKILVFSNIAIQYVPNWLLNRIRGTGAKLVLYFLDDLSNRNSQIALNKTKQIAFDGIWTFDKENAESNGFHYMNSMYSASVKKTITEKYDACFIGSDKGRFSIIADIYNNMIEKNGKFFCSVYQTDENYKKSYKNMCINESIDYERVTEIVQESNCIIDIVLGQQSGLSLRAYEALAYNKKLLTNNPSIFTLPQYNEQYMRYFNRVEDIDWNFVLQKEKVDYGYSGEYSPIAFLKKVCEFL